MATRSATDTIKGYFYQFDCTILKLLEFSEDTDSVVVENIEDIDIKTPTEDVAIQCKYYEGTEYNHSVIAKPIRLMLSHFKDVKNGVKPAVSYYLYGHFKSGQDKLPAPIEDIEFLKEHFLSYKKAKDQHHHHLELNLSDKYLSEFLSKLQIDINADNYDAQIKKIRDLLLKQFSCTEFQVDHFYYNGALKCIKDIAIQKDVVDRKITKMNFINKIDTKKVLFNEWFIQIKGEKLYLQKLRNEYFGNLNTGLVSHRIFLIEINADNYCRQEVKYLLESLATKYTKIDNEPEPFCPYVYFESIPNDELIEIKKDLMENNILIKDGFDFEGADFNKKSLLTPPNKNHRIKLKFLNRLEYLNQFLPEIKRKAAIYQFYFNNQIFDTNDLSINQVKIQINKLNHIKEII
ncbi:hypothetical protein JCM14076_18000 [Methylosoma difficile]